MCELKQILEISNNRTTIMQGYKNDSTKIHYYNSIDLRTNATYQEQFLTKKSEIKLEYFTEFTTKQ